MGREQRLHAASNSGGHFNVKQGRIRDWMIEAGYQIGAAQADNAMWVVGAIHPMGLPLSIVQPRQPSDVLVVQVQVELDETARQKFGELNSEQRETFLFRMKLALLQMGVAFADLGEPLQRFLVNQTIYDDGLTKDNFFQRVDQVRYAALYVIWSLNQKLGRPTQDDWQETLNVH